MSVTVTTKSFHEYRHEYREELRQNMIKFILGDAFSSFVSLPLHIIELEAKRIVPPRLLNMVEWEIWYREFAIALDTLFMAGRIEFQGFCLGNNSVEVMIRKAF